jgi:hypothetical protein
MQSLLGRDCASAFAFQPLQQLVFSSTWGENVVVLFNPFYCVTTLDADTAAVVGGGGGFRDEDLRSVGWKGVAVVMVMVMVMMMMMVMVIVKMMMMMMMMMILLHTQNTPHR